MNRTEASDSRRSARTVGSVTGESKLRQARLGAEGRRRRAREVTKGHKIQHVIELYADNGMRVERASRYASRHNRRFEHATRRGVAGISQAARAKTERGLDRDGEGA